MVTRIRLEGFTNSKVMDSASEMMDRIGPRLTGSPEMKEANEWTKNQLASWGLANAHLESWGPFGRGWTWSGCAVRMTSPGSAELVAIPEAWTPGTAGPVRAKAARLNVKSADELEKLKGKFAGTIVFFGEERDIPLGEKPDSIRYDEKTLAAEFQYDMPGGAPRYNRAEYIKRRELRKAVTKFLEEEKALAVVAPGRGDMGTFSVQGQGTWKKGAPQGLPSLSMEPESFGRVARLLDRDVAVEVEIDVKARFIEEDQMQWNTIAEIPGTDRKDEVVMIGAHLDSWHGGTGATDNGAGSVVAMEAMRILKAVGAKPRRTIRIGLWSGEEQGLFGSRAYVSQHFASRPEPSAEEKEKPFFLRKKTGPLTVKPEHARLSAYFNIDNGTGKIRGIYAEDNAAAIPIFEAWLEPFHDLGATLVTMNRTRRHGPPVLRRRRAPGLPVRSGRPRIRDANAPHEHGRLRAAPEERPDAGLGHPGLVCVRRGDARRNVSEKAHAEGRAAEAGAEEGRCAGGEAERGDASPLSRRGSSDLVP